MIESQQIQPSRMIEQRRQSVTDDYFKGRRRFFDAQSRCEVIKIFSGEWHVSHGNSDEIIATILGSCVAACIRDPLLQIGGMNHFLLPGDSTDSIYDARYGAYAMESLINGIMKAGGRKERLEFKVFGGGNVIRNSSRIGSQNAKFIRDFLKREGFRIVSEDLEGDYPRSIRYHPASGQVMMRMLRRAEDRAVVEEEARYRQWIQQKPTDGSIEIF